MILHQPGPRREDWFGALVLALVWAMVVVLVMVAGSRGDVAVEPVLAPVPGAGAAVPDVAFRIAVEGFVHDTRRVRDLDQVVDPAQARLVRRLGCNCFECRDSASLTLASLGPRAFRALMWGRHHKDAEVRARCEALIARLDCPTCRGTRVCRDIGAYGSCWRCRDDGFEACHDCRVPTISPPLGPPQ